MNKFLENEQPWVTADQTSKQDGSSLLKKASDYLIKEFPTYIRMQIQYRNTIVFDHNNPNPKLDIKTFLLQKYISLFLPLTPYLKYSTLDYFQEMKNVRSVTKSVVSALIGIAIDQNFLHSTDQTLSEFFPEVKNTPKSAITISQLLSNTSGFPSIDHLYAMKAMLKSQDWTRYILDLPLVQMPGEGFIYSSANFHLLTTILARIPDNNIMDFAIKNLFDPIGINTFFWEKSPTGIPFGGANLFIEQNDMLRFGLLFLQKGVWEKKQIISKEWIFKSTQAHISANEEEQYGYGWWVKKENKDGRNNTLVISACGVGGQRIYIIPTYQCVVTVTCLTSLYADSRIVDRIIPLFILPYLEDLG